MMAEQNKQQQLAEDEQQQLAGFEERAQWSKGQLENSFPTNRIATLGEIQHAAVYTQQLVDWFRTNYGPKASSLQAAGFPELANRLNTLITDLEQAHTIYVSMYQEKMQPSVPPVSPPLPIPNMIAEMNHRNALFNASIFNECWNCHLSLGDAFSQLEWCPNCKVMLHK